VNVAFTFAGLQTLGVPDAWLSAFPDDFREGAWQRAEANGDRGLSAREHWMHGVGHSDVLLVVHAEDATTAANVSGGLVDDARAGLQPRHVLDAALLRSPGAADENGETCITGHHREHFGFADGCSQPAIQYVDDDPTGDGVYARRAPTGPRAVRQLTALLEDLGLRRPPREWRTVRAGEFVLGYENEDGRMPDGPPAPLGPNGTFMVYRVLKQDVEAFDAYVASQAPRIAAARGRERAAIEKLLRAKIVGRWQDGTPLTLSPERPDRLIASNRRRANNFLYREARDGYRADADGYGCPLGGHIRRANPRDALPGGGERAMRHRIIRRGLPYVTDDEKGLAFVCFNASIANGFEFIQRRWCNDGAATGLGAERDVMLQPAVPGELTGMTVPARDGRSVVLAPPERPLVTVRGCEYLFLPSRRACEWLAGLR
jgi:Dyp-type peroxidase family